MSGNQLWQRSRQKIYFKSDDMDFYFTWILGCQSYGGTTLGECLQTASRIKDGDPDSWTDAWVDTARRVENIARRAFDKGHYISAREAFFRASNYYRAAAIGIRARDPWLQDVWDKAKACFQKAGTLLHPPIEAIQIPFNTGHLPGYFMRAGTTHKQRPTLIFVTGGEGSAEDAYIWIGSAGIRRGYNVLAFDGPGNPGALFMNPEMILRPDCEVPLKAVVDYALARHDVDADRLAMIGFSGGGYMVLRAIAHDDRIKACIADAPITDLHSLASAELPDFVLRAPSIVGDALARMARLQNPMAAIAIEKFLWQAGTNRLSDALDRARAATLDGLTDKIRCPVLCLISEGESDEQLRQAREFYEALTVRQKQLHVFTMEDGADAHCQVNNFNLMNQIVYDWLDGIFA